MWPEGLLVGELRVGGQGSVGPGVEALRSGRNSEGKPARFPDFYQRG